jgi:hypothetical protein
MCDHRLLGLVATARKSRVCSLPRPRDIASSKVLKPVPYKASS